MSASSTPLKRIVGWPTGKVCVNGGSSMISTPGPLVDEEQRRPEIAAVLVLGEHVDDEEVGHVAAGREPLLGVHHPAVAAMRRAVPTHASGIGAGVGLGDRVALARARRAARGGGSGRSGRACRARARWRRVGMYHQTPFVLRPKASWTTTCSSRLMPWPPCSGEWSSPTRPASWAARGDRAPPSPRAGARRCARPSPRAAGSARRRSAAHAPRAPPRSRLAHDVRSAASSANTSMKRSMSASSCCTESVHSSSRPGVMKTPRFML